MKKNWINHTLALFVFSLIGLPAFAQGLLIEKKDGSQIKVPYEELDYMTVYDAEQPDNEDSVLPVRYGKQLVGYASVDSVTETSGADWDVYRQSNSFTFDAKGRFQKHIFYENEWEEVTTYKWHGNQVDLSDEYENGTFTIENGKVVSYVSDDGEVQYSYDKNGQVVQYNDKNTYEPVRYDYIWENGRIVQINEYDGELDENITHTFEYADDKVCEAYNPYMYYTLGYNEFFTVHPCFAGKLMNQLPSRVTTKGEKGSQGVVDYSYELDADGYVSKIQLKSAFKYYDERNQEFYNMESVETITYTWK